MIEVMAELIREYSATPEVGIAIAGNWWHHHDTWPTGREILQELRNHQTHMQKANLIALLNGDPLPFPPPEHSA